MIYITNNIYVTYITSMICVTSNIYVTYIIAF
ncbi:hypothetical protein HBN54_004193 [Hymenobacter sp. 1B]|uniref:Uncharacterized protein n=1 Tax=Hymenobacter artigasi TaxID=2719616 RepID=A0ABX1HMT8_9BACT|nr:hypothetical protein [Hymenobacter artigasi]